MKLCLKSRICKNTSISTKRSITTLSEYAQFYFNKHDFTNAYKTINDYAIQTEIEFALFLNSNKLAN